MKIFHFLILFLISVNLNSTQEVLTLGFGSCLHQDRSMDILKTIEKKELDLFMFIGDNVYGDQKDGELDKLIRTYKQQSNNLEIFLKNVRTEFIWDDHDFGLNDGGSNYRYKDRAKELFLETWKIPSKDPRRLRDGLYFDKIINKNGLKVQLIFLDNRSFKSEWKLTDEFNKEGKECFSFGKHKGKNVQEILDKEPGYFGWLLNAEFPLYTKKILTEIRIRNSNLKNR